MRCADCHGWHRSGLFAQAVDLRMEGPGSGLQERALHGCLASVCRVSAPGGGVELLVPLFLLCVWACPRGHPSLGDPLSSLPRAVSSVPPRVHTSRSFPRALPDSSHPVPGKAPWGGLTSSEATEVPLSFLGILCPPWNWSGGTEEGACTLAGLASPLPSLQVEAVTPTAEEGTGHSVPRKGLSTRPSWQPACCLAHARHCR